MSEANVSTIEQANQEIYDRLLVSIEAGLGLLQIFIAVCDADRQREQIIANYERELSPHLHTYRVNLDLTEPSLRRAIASVVPSAEKAIVTVSGTEILGLSSPDELDKFFGYLQWTRESLREFKLPIVLWIPSRIFNILAKRSPDFWSWRNGVFQFQPEPSFGIFIQGSSISNSNVIVKPSSILSIEQLEELLTQTIAKKGKENRSVTTLYAQLGDLYFYRIQQGNSIDLAREIDLAQTYLKGAIELARKFKQPAELAASLYSLAKLDDRIGKWHEALQSCHDSLAINREIGNRQGEAASLHQIAIIYTNQGKWDEALQSCRDSLSINREIGNRQGEAASLHQIAIIYTNQGKWHEALQSCRDSLAINREIGNRQGEAASLNLIAMIYTNQGKWDKALKSCRDSLAIKREIGDRQGEAASLNQMGYVAGKQGDIAQEEQFYLAAAQVCSDIGNYNGLITSLRNLGFTVEAQALTYLAQALWLTLRIATNLQSTISLIEAIYQEVPTGDPLEALLGATALYFCQDSPHPDRSSLTERSFAILSHAASQQGITTEAAFDDWIVQNRLNDRNYFLPALDARLRETIGDKWLFDPQQVG